MVRARNSYEPGTRPSRRSPGDRTEEQSSAEEILSTKPHTRGHPLSGTKETWTAPFAPLLWSGLLAGLIATGVDMKIEIAPGLSPEEQSITIYHEVIEVASLQAKQPPPTVLDLSEQEIDLLAKMAHEQYGLATVETLNHLLRDLGF